MKQRVDDWDWAGSCLESYRLKVVRLTPLSDFHALVDTTERSYEAHLSTPSSAAWRMWVGDYAARHRVRALQRFVQNLYDERFVPVGTRTFYITNAVPGDMLTITPDDIDDAARWLANLHSGLEGAAAGRNAAAPKPRYGAWQGALTAGRAELASVGSQRQVGAAASTIEAQWGDRWRSLADAVIGQLDAGSYAQAAQAAARKTEVAWNGFRLNRLRRAPTGRVSGQQLSDPVLDNSVYDLATLCQEVCEAGQADGVEEAIEVYAQVRPLTAAERRSVVAYAAFPHVALATVRQLRQRQGEQDDGLYEELLKRSEQHYRAAQRLLTKS